MKLWFQVYNVILWYILQNDHHNKSGEHLLLEIVLIFFLQWELKRSLQFSSVQLFSCIQLFVTPWSAAWQGSLSLTNSWSLLKLMSIQSVATQPSHPLSSPSPAFSLSQHQALFQWVSSSHRLAKVLQFQLQHQSFQRVFRTNFLYDCLVWSCSPRERVFSNATVQKHQFFSAQLSFIVQLFTSLHDYWKNHSFD